MGCILSCIKKQKSEEEYIMEIFDGLDIDGTQNLDADEIELIWKRVKENRLTKLKAELRNYVDTKNNEIEATTHLNSNSMLEKNKPVTLKQFKPIIKSLNMNRDELHQLWIETKQNEIASIQNLLNEE
tara:strand:+ start:750 stop:1133 length:384 start_codon:yes stop_codon:yes gene_type:complete